MNLYFLKLTGPLRERFGSHLPDGFPLPIASEASQEEVLSQVTEEDVLRGLLHAIGHLRDDPNRAGWTGLLERLRPGLAAELSQTLEDRLNAQDWETGLEVAQLLTDLAPGDPRAALQAARFHEEHAASLAKTEHWEKANDSKVLARRWYQEALGSDSPLPAAFANAGYFYLSLGEWERSEEVWTRYLEMAGEDEVIEKALGQLRSRRREDELFKSAYDYVLMGREEEAIINIDNFLESRSDVWNAWFLKGWALRRLERHAEALPLFRKAMELNPGHTDTMNEAALCLFQTKDYKGARILWKQALLSEPENTKIMSNLGVLSKAEGKRDEAAAYFRAVLEYAPDDPLAAQSLRELDEEPPSA